MSDVLIELQERVAIVTLHRPDSRNALTSDMIRQLRATLEDAERDPEVDIIVLTGSDPSFCAGLDLKELGSGGQGFSADTISGGERRGSRGPLPTLTKPLIGAINGAAITGGLELALLCDFLVASDRARFADTHSRVGIQPGWGLTLMLPQAVGVRRAREMSATGNFIDASTALFWGLVNHVVPHNELIGFTLSLASDVVSNDQNGVRRLFLTYSEGAALTQDRAWEIERTAARLTQGAGLNTAEIERRRQQVIGRGRTQV